MKFNYPGPGLSGYSELMRKFTFLLLLSIIPAAEISAQGSATISGRVTDQVADKPLPYATVTLNTKAENTIIAGTITREDGIFILNNISSGEYKINVSYIGYKDITTEILLGSLNLNYDIGKIELSPDVEELKEVRIVGERDIISQGMEKKTFNIDENIAQSGGSVLKAIQNLPGITVDPDGIVYLRGSDKVTILMDGKQSSLTGYGNQKGLDNIPASNIESIEIINNPSAKYDAKGLAGIINIIYKKEKQTGLSGEFGLSAGVGELNQRRKNLPGIMKKIQLHP